MRKKQEKKNRPRGLLILIAVCTACAIAGCGETAGSGGSGGEAGAGGMGAAGGAAGGAGGFNPLDGIGAVELIDGSFVFTEGPTWRAADGKLLFTDIPSNEIYELTPPESIDVFREDSGNANGLDSDVEDLLLAAEHLNRRVSRTLSDGTIVNVASEYQGDRLNSPNDIAVRSDGTIYFTDPPYGISEPQRELDFNGVFRVDPTGGLTVEWQGAISTRPNGLALSPDETILYVADTAAPAVMAFDVSPDGSLSGERVFIADVGAPDGMAIDTGGNLYVSAVGGVRVYDPDGDEWGIIETPDGRSPANCAFGGDDARTLYITAREGLYRVELTHPGLY